MAGGVGAARLLRGLVRLRPPGDITVIANVGDDIVLHGLHISPDLDTITYTLADQINPETGWGMRGETWQAMASVERYGGLSWFRLGDRDLGTHLYRTHRLHEGADLATVTAEITAAWGLEIDLRPVTCDRLETRVTLVDEGEVHFQEYFVRRRHDVAVRSIRFAGAEECRPSPGVLDAIGSAERVVIAPSNPIVSIGPLLAVPGVRDALVARRDDVVAVSPIVGGAALKGPADRLLRELGHESSVAGVAAAYAPIAATLVIDVADRDAADRVAEQGVRCIVTDTIMRDAERAEALCRVVLA